MAEFGLAIIVLGVLLLADRRRLNQLTDQVRRLLDWLERSS